MCPGEPFSCVAENQIDALIGYTSDMLDTRSVVKGQPRGR